MLMIKCSASCLVMLTHCLYSKVVLNEQTSNLESYHVFKRLKNLVPFQESRIFIYSQQYQPHCSSTHTG